MKNKILPLSLIILTACGSTTSGNSFEVSSMIKSANEYIKENIATVNTDYKGDFHLSSPIGWMNDPNGFSEFDNKYHLFYQYNPYDAVWGPMHWGHQTTDDFVKWNLEDVALAPDKDYDQNGCFSGTAINIDDKLYLAYTSVDKDWNQDQAIAYSLDGITFKKLDNNPVINGNSLPNGFSHPNFRDPKILSRDNKYYMLVGNENTLTHDKQIIIFESDYIDKNWTYKGVSYSRQDVGGILECPDLFTIGNYDVLVASPQSIKSDKYYQYQNVDSCIYQIGNLSTHSGKFFNKQNVDVEEFDKGFSFYAPQVLKTSDDRLILTAWMKAWAEMNITQADNWAGSMVFPRELSLKDNHIYQQPVRELKNYYVNNYQEELITLENNLCSLNDIKDNKCSIELTIDIGESGNSTKAGIEVYKSQNYSTRIYYDVEKGCVVFDRSNCGSLLDGVRYAKVEPIDNKIKLQILLDVSSCEVFINDGYYTQTGNIFAPLIAKDISLFSENGKVSFMNINYNHIDIEKKGGNV